jgi:hypothetical protein
MKATIGCVICMKEASKKLVSDGVSTSVKFFSSEIDDNGVVYLMCDKGHRTAGVLLGRKHQYLFESGCNALLDDYTNEAVSSFSAALERAYEFFIRVAYRKLGISSSILDKTWKNVKAQSERQFGAFVLLYPLISGEPFELPERIPELRNKVIHRGYIARGEKVLEYAKDIFSIIRQIIAVLNNKCPSEMWAEINEAAQAQKNSVPAEMEWIFLGVTPFDMTVDLTFESWMEELKTQRLKKGIE